MRGGEEVKVKKVQRAPLPVLPGEPCSPPAQTLTAYPSIDLRTGAPPTNEKSCNQMQLWHFYDHVNGVWCRSDAHLMSSFISNEK